MNVKIISFWDSANKQRSEEPVLAQDKNGENFVCAITGAYMEETTEGKVFHGESFRCLRAEDELLRELEIGIMIAL